jgi:monoamine oxidase
MRLNRREFFRWSGVAAGGFCLSRDLGWALPQRPENRQGGGKRIVILGAGLAGLSAGWELTRAGHDVTILEAQLHPGGRVHTIREGLSDGLYAEAGAGRIPNTHSVTLEWVKHFGLPLEPFFPKEGVEIALIKGKRVRMPVDGRCDMTQVPLDLTPEERNVGLVGLDAHYYADRMHKIGDAIRTDWPPELERLDDITMADFLRKRGASEDAIHYMTFGFEDDAALDFMRDAYSHHTKSLSKIKGGNDQLPRAFAAKLSDVIRYGCAVEHIEHKPEKVRIAFRRAGMLDSIAADAVVCAIPFGVLRLIPVTPEWSSDKRAVIDNLVYGPVVRTTFQVDRRYWQAEGLNGFGSSDKNFEVWNPTYGKPGRRGLLQSYVYEDYAHRLDQMSDNERIPTLTGDMDEVHPGLKKHLETVIVKSWVNDPWQRGAYVVYHPHQQKWYSDVCKREGKIWFAGEHASPWPGWMQGAIFSGIKAAKEINTEFVGSAG